MEYYSAMKRDDALIYSTTWPNLENVRLSARNQKKTTSHVIVFIRNVPNRQICIDQKADSWLFSTEGGWGQVKRMRTD